MGITRELIHPETMTTQSDIIKAARALGVDKLRPIQHAALRLVMLEISKRPEYRDTTKVSRIAARFRIGKAVSYYWTRPEMWFA
jgi:hypothetical protein